ncbi:MULTISPECIES: DUF6571 family protein [Streptomyces]|uniref:DUF6571 family protein n=1 Tax=Streptomyces TaxID=1883 RepID=UPI0004BDE28E|nr:MULTISPECIES: DUF6571 family protein [Streptomyces]
MELTYHDIMNADFSALTTTAKEWRSMADGCGTVGDNYRDHVRGKLKGWSGDAADAFWGSSDTTRYELSAAQRQARAIAGLLDEAHAKLTEARQALKKVRDEAVDEGGMTIDDYGKCTLDTSGMSDERAQSALRDPGRADEEMKWNHRIVRAVQHVDDVDWEMRQALEAAAEDTDGKGDDNGFNGAAIGDVETYAGKRSAQLAAQLDVRKDDYGISSAERREFQMLMKLNSDNKEFSRTLLDSLGPQGTIDASNQLSQLAYRTDTGHRKQYLAIEGDLATALATATRVPEFKGANGKKLGVGSTAYGEKYRAWLDSKDGAFYGRWRKGMREAGSEKWFLPVQPAGTTGNSGVEGVGYQSLLSLMRHGDGYSPQMLHDLGDDIRAAEEKDADIWDRPGPERRSDDDAYMRNFSRDPYGDLLGIMAKDPEVAASYLDPRSDPDPADGKAEKNDRLAWLVKERDWDVVDTDSRPGADSVDKHGRDGFEAALKAGATGRLPDSDAAHTPPHHSAANSRVMAEAVSVFGRSAGGVGGLPIAKDGDFVDLRGTLGEIIADYPGDVQRHVYGDEDLPVNGVAARFDEGALHEYLREVGKDPHAYGVVKASQQLYTSERLAYVLHNLPEGADPSDVRDYAGDAVAGGAYVSGILSEAKADALYEDEVAKARDFNESADEASKWVNRFVGLGTGSIPTGEGAQGLLPTPIGWAQEDINSAVMEQIKKDVPQVADDAERDGRYRFVNTQSEVSSFARRLAERAGKHADLDPALVKAAEDGARIRSVGAFQDGSGTARSHGSAGPAS